jgi:hypothetical protein
MNSTEQQFFNALEAKLWTAANKLLPSLGNLTTVFWNKF